MKKHTRKATPKRTLAEISQELKRDLEALSKHLEKQDLESYAQARKILAKLYTFPALKEASRAERLKFAKQLLQDLETLRIESDKHALDFGDFLTGEARKPFPEIEEEEAKEFEALTAEFSRRLSEEKEPFQETEGAGLKEQEEIRGKHLADFLASVERLAQRAESKKAEKILRDFLRYMNEKTL